jgi:hypothetical protein
VVPQDQGFFPKSRIENVIMKVSLSFKRVLSTIQSGTFLYLKWNLSFSSVLVCVFDAGEGLS